MIIVPIYDWFIFFLSQDFNQSMINVENYWVVFRLIIDFYSIFLASGVLMLADNRYNLR